MLYFILQCREGGCQRRDMCMFLLVLPLIEIYQSNWLKLLHQYSGRPGEMMHLKTGEGHWKLCEGSTGIFFIWAQKHLCLRQKEVKQEDRYWQNACLCLTHWRHCSRTVHPCTILSLKDCESHYLHMSAEPLPAVLVMYISKGSFNIHTELFKDISFVYIW